MTVITRDRVTGTRSSLAAKAPCLVATTDNTTLAGAQTIDGVLVSDGDRVLVRAQDDASENGIYEVRQITNQAWVRAGDWQSDADVTTGTRVYVQQGTVASGEYYVSTLEPISVGTTPIAIDAYTNVGSGVSSVGGFTGAVTAAQVKTTYEANADTNALTDAFKAYLDTIAGVSGDGEFIVSTGAGAIAWESGATARASMGVYSTAEVDAAIAGLDISNKIDGPVTSTDSAIVVYDGTSGKLAKDSSATIDSAGGITTPYINTTRGKIRISSYMTTASSYLDQSTQLRQAFIDFFDEDTTHLDFEGRMVGISSQIDLVCGVDGFTSTPSAPKNFTKRIVNGGIRWLGPDLAGPMLRITCPTSISAEAAFKEPGFESFRFDSGGGGTGYSSTCLEFSNFYHLKFRDCVFADFEDGIGVFLSSTDNSGNYTDDNGATFESCRFVCANGTQDVGTPILAYCGDIVVEGGWSDFVGPMDFHIGSVHLDRVHFVNNLNSPTTRRYAAIFRDPRAITVNSCDCDGGVFKFTNAGFLSGSGILSGAPSQLAATSFRNINVIGNRMEGDVALTSGEGVITFETENAGTQLFAVNIADNTSRSSVGTADFLKVITTGAGTYTTVAGNYRYADSSGSAPGDADFGAATHGLTLQNVSYIDETGVQAQQLRVLDTTGIWAGSSTNLIMRTDGTHRWQVGSAGNLTPWADSTYNLGSPSAKVATVYADNVSISGTAVSGATVSTRTALKALDTTVFVSAYLAEDGRAGAFVFRSGDYSAEVTADTAEGVYIAADGIATSTGAWVRELDGSLQVEWFGASAYTQAELEALNGDAAVATQAAANSTAFQAAVDMAETLGGYDVMALGQIYVLDTRLEMPQGVILVGRGTDEWEPVYANRPKLWDGTSLLFKGTGTADITFDGITSMRNAGGWPEDPDSPGSYFKLFSAYNADASGTTAATQRTFSAAIASKNGDKYWGLKHLRVVNWCGTDGIEGFSDQVSTSLGDDWDIGVLLLDAEYVSIDDVQVVGGWREFALLDISEIGNQASNERNRIENCKLQGRVGLGLRSADRWEVNATTVNSVTVTWSEEHYFSTGGGSFRGSDNVDYTYTGLSFSSPNLTLTGVSPDPSGIFHLRHTGTGFANSQFVNCYVYDLWHQSGSSATTLGLSDSKSLEMSGFPLRGVSFENCKFHGPEPVLAQIHDAFDVRMWGCQYEGGGHFIASPVTTASTATAPAGETRALFIDGDDGLSDQDLRLFLPRTAFVQSIQVAPEDDLTGDFVLTPLRSGQDLILRPQTSGTITMDGGVVFSNAVAASETDLSDHLALYGTTYGFSITSDNINMVANGSNTFSSTQNNLTSKVNHNFSNGIAVTGNISVTGTVDGVDVSARDHDAVTLAGTLDYLTLSGQQITLNAIDLSTDVTGTLPGTAVSETGIDHDALDNFVANEHIDWTNTSSNFDTSGSLRVTGGINTSTNIAASATDLSDHIALYSTTYGINVTSNNLNFVANGNNNFSVTSSTATSRAQHNFNLPPKINHSYTVATLPAAAGAVSQITQVTDANAPAVGSTVAGGGSARALVWSNGSNWTVIGV